jgi:hypothetical protein
MQFSRKTGWLVPAVFVAVAALPARAVEPDKHMAPDCEGVVVVNIRQMLDSPIVKKYGLGQLKEAINGNEDAKKFFKKSGLDPLKDIHSIHISGSAGGGKPKFLVVVRGDYDVEKIQAAIADEAKAKGEDLKFEMKGDLKVYQLSDGKGGKDQQPMFGAFADKNTLLIAQSADAVVAASKAGDGKVDAKLKTALSKLDEKASVYTAFVVTDELKKVLANNQQMKDLATKLEYFTGSFDLTKDVNIRLAAQTTDADAAKKLKMFVNQFMPLLGLLASGNEKVGPVLTELIKKIEVKTDGTAVVISLNVTEEMLKEIGEAAGGLNQKQ